MISVTKSFEFSASHTLARADFTAEENLQTYGKCSNLHGHNYTLEVTITGSVDGKTGMILDVSKLAPIIENEILNHVDHRDLDRDVPWFLGKVTTAEVVLEEFWNRAHRAISAAFPQVQLARMRLWETRRIYAEKTA